VWCVRAATALVALMLQPADLVTHKALRQANRWRTHLDVAAASVSDDGRYVAFTSHAPLLPTDTNGVPDIYIHDLATGQLTLESLTASGGASNGSAAVPRLSGDGRFLAFESHAMNFDDEGSREVLPQVYLRDRVQQTTRRVAAPAGAHPNGPSFAPVLSGDGRFVAFESHATNLVQPDANGVGADVYVWDRVSDVTERASVDGAGRQPPVGTSFTPRISADGARVAFTSTADLECAAVDECSPREQDTNGVPDVYVRDRALATTVRVSRPSNGTEADGPSHHPDLSADGRLVAFASRASNLLPGDENRAEDVFLHELETRRTRLVSRGADGGFADGRSLHPAVTDSGRHVFFHSTASKLVCARACDARTADRNGTWDVFVFDRETGRVARVSGAAGGRGWSGASMGAAPARRAMLVAFSSFEPTDASDTRADADLFVLRWR
jgi:Tol biopolymer transport system component